MLRYGCGTALRPTSVFVAELVVAGPAARSSADEQLMMNQAALAFFAGFPVSVIEPEAVRRRGR